MLVVKTTKKTTEKVIEDITYSSSHQSISRRIIYEYKNLKIKLELQSDGYKRQCYARASALDGLEWKLIYFIPHSEMKTPEGLCYCVPYRDEKAPNAKREFDRDIERLKKYITKIL